MHDSIHAILNAPPSDMSTSFTMLITLVYIAETLGQDHIIVTADMAIYNKAQEILWNNPAELKGKVTMTLEAMNLSMPYREGGLLSMLTDSEIYAEATA